MCTSNVINNIEFSLETTEILEVFCDRVPFGDRNVYPTLVNYFLRTFLVIGDFFSFEIW